MAQYTPEPENSPIEDHLSGADQHPPLPDQPLPPPYQPPNPSNNPYAYAQRPPKDKSIAFILEILPGLFGFLGFGWIYSGNTTTGLLILFGYLAWIVVAVIIDIATGGLACFCTLPVNIAAIAISTVMLNNYTKQHPELFGP